MEPAMIEISEVKRRLGNGEEIYFFDARSNSSWNSSDVKIPSAVRIHHSELEQRLGGIPHDRIIVTYCT